MMGNKKLLCLINKQKIPFRRINCLNGIHKKIWIFIFLHLLTAQSELESALVSFLQV